MRSLAAAVLALAMAAGPQLADAQPEPARSYRIGVLTATDPAAASTLRHLLRALAELGYVEGQNVSVERRGREGTAADLAPLAADLVATKPDILVGATSLPTRALKDTGTTIPIVFAMVSDPLELGAIESFARPGRNITGATNNTSEAAAKRLQLLIETVPHLSRLAVIYNPHLPSAVIAVRHTRQIADERGIGVALVEVSEASQIAKALEEVVHAKTDALLMVQDAVTTPHLDTIMAIARQHRLPTMCGVPRHAATGCFMAYGEDVVANTRRAALLIHRVLRGANPAELPIEQPHTLQLVVNARTARDIGLNLPPWILLLADEVIE
jgi:ABC-type uncharacterized transport system substrate-binding protein